MSDTAFRMQSPPPVYMTGLRISWGAVWAGVFTFAAIWCVFEVLAVALFPAATATVATSAYGMSVGMAIWTVVLTVIAMYVAGVETGRMAGISSRHDGLIHGMIMFGLSVVSVIVVASLVNGFLMAGTAVRGGYTMTLTPRMQWAEFIALFLGWLAAMGGASLGVTRRTAEVKQPIQMKPAA